MARDYERDRIARARLRHCSGRFRIPNPPGHLGVRSRLPERDALQLLPHSPLECRGTNIERQIEIRFAAIEIREYRRDPAVQLAALVLDDAGGGELRDQIGLER